MAYFILSSTHHAPRTTHNVSGCQSIYPFTLVRKYDPASGAFTTVAHPSCLTNPNGSINFTFTGGADLKHAMTKRSKHSFASADQAREFQAKYGGTLAKFDEALREAYVDMATDVSMIRKMREERRQRAAQQKQG